MNEKLFGDEDSPLRENPAFRRYMEEYNFLNGRMKELQENRGYLSYEETIELEKLKKLKLAVKDVITSKVYQDQK